MKTEIQPTNDQSPAVSTVRTWSVAGVVALLLVPAVVWAIGAILTTDLQPVADAASSGKTPNIADLGNALTAFMARIVGIVMYVLALVHWLRGPSAIWPKWMTRVEPSEE